MPPPHHCPTCTKSYIRKVYFDRHVSLCGALSRSQTTRDQMAEFGQETLPSYSDLVELVRDLSSRCAVMEKRIIQMNHVDRTNMKISIADITKDLCIQIPQSIIPNIWEILAHFTPSIQELMQLAVSFKSKPTSLSNVISEMFMRITTTNTEFAKTIFRVAAAPTTIFLGSIPDLPTDAHISQLSTKDGLRIVAILRETLITKFQLWNQTAESQYTRDEYTEIYRFIASHLFGGNQNSYPKIASIIMDVRNFQHIAYTEMN